MTLSGIGANIQSVRDKTGARIIFPNEKDKDREVITILGTKEAVAQAKIELESRIKDLVSNAGLFVIPWGSPDWYYALI